MAAMHVTDTLEASAWDAFLSRQRYRPFLQSWTMGEVYGDIGQRPIRLAVTRDERCIAICQAVVVPARRGRHLAVLYGPLFDAALTPDDVRALLPAFYDALRDAALAEGCSFIRMSPFLELEDGMRLVELLDEHGVRPLKSPLHLLAEHIWYLPLGTHDAWAERAAGSGQRAATGRTEEEILMAMRKTTRNLIRRAEKDGVTVEASTEPLKDVETFIKLHDETRKRHKFTPYSNAFFRAQVRAFSPRNEATVYVARWQDKVIAASIHMHAFGETSYHHGASDSLHSKVPASYLLQWTAIKDALKRGDHVYNFWGIAPVTPDAEGTPRVADPKHPFAGVTLFKSGFGGELLDLTPCIDLPLKFSYRLTRAFEFVRKWRRGF
jgi:peptidoglycan pentaglycine glycine transferase (the first glycine)